jgi:hypothetical protein
MPERLPKLEKAARTAHASGLGKLLPMDLYIAKGLVAELPEVLRAQVAKGEEIAGRRRYPYSIVKIGLDGRRISFLSYPKLETVKLPQLARTAAVNLDARTVSVIDYSQRAEPPVLHRKELIMGKKAKAKKNPKSVPAAVQATRQVLSKRNRLAASLTTTAKRRAFAAVDQRKTPMADGAIKVTFGGWGIKDGLTHRYDVRAKVGPKGGITLHWSNKSAKGKTAAKALDAAAKQGLLPNRSGAARWRDAREAAVRAAGAKKNPLRKPYNPKLPTSVTGAKKKTAKKKPPKPRTDRVPFSALKKGDKFWWSPDRFARELMVKVGRDKYKMSRYFGSFVHIMGDLGRKVYAEVKVPKAVIEAARKAPTKQAKPKKKKLPKSVSAAVKKAAAKAKMRKNPATGLTQLTAQQAKLDLETRGYSDISLSKAAGGNQLSFPAWAKAKPHRRVRLVATFSQPYVGEGTIKVTLHVKSGSSHSLVGSRTATQSIQAVPFAGILAGKKYQGRKPVGAKAPARKRPSILAGMFANPADEKQAWATVQKVFKKERAAMSKQFPALISTGLRPDPKVHDTERHYAETGKNGRGQVWVTVAPSLGLLPMTKIVGVIRHELGHAAIFHGFEPRVRGKTARLAQYDRVERQADRVAEKLSGAKIYYDAKNIEVAGPGARGKRPRPAGFR